MGYGLRGGPRFALDKEEVDLKNYDYNLIRRLVREYVRPYVKHILIAIFLMVFISLMGLLGPYLIKVAIDTYIPKGDLNGIALISIFYLLSNMAIWVASYWETYNISWTSQNVIFELRQRLFEHLQRLSLGFYDRTESGRIMSRVTNDINALSEVAGPGMVRIIGDFFTIFTTAAIMLTMNTKLAFISFTTIPFIIILMTSFRTRIRKAYHTVRRKVADVNANLQESISGVRVVQTFSREQTNLQKFDSTNMENFQANMQAAGLHALFMPLVQFVGSLGTALVLWYGGLLVIDSEISLGVVIAFISYIQRFFSPIANLSEIYNMIQAALVSTERVFSILDTEPEVKDIEGAIELPPIQGRVDFENVVFGYDPQNPVIHGISFHAESGEMIALVGATGSGKTTTINLLARFYEAQEGRITIDGIDIMTVTLSSLRRQLGIVLQDNFIFSGTVKENIKYGRPDASDDQVIAAAKAVNAHDFIVRLPEGYDTQVQERGSRLSVGQRQLVSFARAILTDPRILILDEATSSVDAYTEMIIQQALERLLKGRTSIVIAHRLSTILKADKILVIDKGKIIEEGTHDELLALSGKYKELYEAQFR